MNYKIENNKLVLCDQWGNRNRFISDNVSYATYDDTQKIHVVDTNSKLLLYEKSSDDGVYENWADSRQAHV